MPRLSTLWICCLLVCLTLLGSRAGAQVVAVKTWYAPDQPLAFRNGGESPVKIILTSFQNTEVPLKDARGENRAEAPILQPGDEIDLRQVYAAINVGTYLLYAVAPEEETIVNFTGTPHVIEVRRDDRPEAPDGPIVVKVEPLRLASIETEYGTMEVAFYYDAAPHTVANFIDLAGGGFYDGLTFHRIVPGFVIQGGDPIGDGTGGPGYRIDAEFNDRPHLPGALSMAREGDPIEQQGAPPRDRARNSAGSQFFIALDYETTRRLDGRYTVFGRVVDGMTTVRAMASLAVADEATGQPAEPPIIEKIEILPVTAARNPYPDLLAIDDDFGEADGDDATTQPTTQDAAE